MYANLYSKINLFFRGYNCILSKSILFVISFFSVLVLTSCANPDDVLSRARNIASSTAAVLPAANQPPSSSVDDNTGNNTDNNILNPRYSKKISINSGFANVASTHLKGWVALSNPIEKVKGEHLTGSIVLTTTFQK